MLTKNFIFSSNKTITLSTVPSGSLWVTGSNSLGRLGLGDIVYRYSPVQLGSGSWKQVSESDTHTLAIKSDGTLWGWGGNAYYATGVASSLNPIYSWSQVSVGPYSTVAIKNDGTLWGWGSAQYAGTGTAPNTLNPVNIASGSWIFADSGGQNGITNGTSLAVKSDGTLWGWGQNGSGTQYVRLFGYPSSVTYSSPVQLGTDTNWKKAVVGAVSAFGIKTDGTLWAWGTDFNGDMGLNSASTSTTSPIQIAGSWSSVFSKNGTTFAINTTGKLFAWGSNTFGQLGDSTLTNRSSPVQIGTSSWTSVGCGSSHTLALRSDGALFATGDKGLYGLLGILETSGVNTWAQVAAGKSLTFGVTSMGIKTDGSLWTWGDNTYGQLGNLTIVSQVVSPIQIGTANSWNAISAGGGHMLAISTTNKLWAWGLGAQGQLGFTATASNNSSPVQVGTSSWTKISAGGSHSVAIRSDGALFGWGLNASGQVGDNTILSRSSLVQLGTSSWTSISAGVNHTAAIRTDGGLFMWGANASGQLGTGDVALRSSPVQIGTSSWTAIASGLSHTLGLKADGTLWAWGDNSSGQVYFASPTLSWTVLAIGGGSASDRTFGIRSDGRLMAWGDNSVGTLGDGTVANRSSPVQIGTSSWTAVAAGNSFTAAIRSDGGLFTWGFDAFGALADGLSSTYRSSPVQVGTSSWTAIAAGMSFALALRSDGALFAWGDNSSGQLGDGTIISRSSPVQIGTSSWTAIATGKSHSVAIRSDGGLFTWGSNTTGWLGSNSVLLRSSPVQIGTSSWIAIAAAGGNTAAIRTDKALFVWGSNNTGQIGDNSILNRSSPVQVGTSSWTQVKVMGTSIYAISAANTLWSWGNSTALGAPSRSSPVQVGTSSWVALATAPNSINTVAAIASTNLAYLWGGNGGGSIGNNTVVSVGTTATLLAGMGFSSINSPIQIGTSSYTAIATAQNTNYALRTDGTLWSWGNNIGGGVGDGTIISRSSPVQIGTSSWAQISAGSSYALGRVGSALYAWGIDTGGNLGLITAASRSSPVQLAVQPIPVSKSSFTQVGTSSWIAVDAGWLTSAGVKADGTLWTWGWNYYGVLGNGDGTALGSMSSPVQVGTSSWTGVVVGRSTGVQTQMLATSTNGTLFGWGYGGFGAIGDGTAYSRSSPVQVGGRPTDFSSPVQVGTSSWSMVATASDYSVGVKADGTLWAWGLNVYGQIGNNSIIDATSPIQIGTSSWTKVYAGGARTLAVKLDNTLWGWGQNSGTVAGGNVGDGTTIHRSSPVQVSTSSFAQISVGSDRALALTATGAVMTWGASDTLGFGVGQGKSIPNAIFASGCTVVAANSTTSVVLSGGTLWAWGSLPFGTGYGPVQVGTSSWASIGTASGNIYSIKSDGSFWGMGNNTFGQLGNGTTTSVTSPPVQLNYTDWSGVRITGYNNTFLLKP